MGGAASFLNPEPIADFTDVIAVGEGEILAYQLVDAILEDESKEEILLSLARIGRGFYVPSLYDVIYNDDGTVFDYLPKSEGVPRRVGRALAAVNPKEGTLRRALKRGENELAEFLDKPGHLLPVDLSLVARGRDGRSAACRDFARLLAGMPVLLGRLQLLSAACRAGQRHSGKGQRVA